MKRIILTFGLVLTGLALFGQSPRIRLNQITKDSLTGSVVLSGSDSNMVYSRNFFLNLTDSVLILFGDTLSTTATAFTGVTTDLTLTGNGTVGTPLKVDTAIIATVSALADSLAGIISSVTTDLTLTGDGSVATPLKVDTSVIATIRAISDSLATLSFATNQDISDSLASLSFASLQDITDTLNLNTRDYITGLRLTDTLNTNSRGFLTQNQTITLTDDATGTGTTSISVTVVNDSHNHTISTLTGIQDSLNSKAALVHSHTISDVAFLQDSLDAKANDADLNNYLLTANYIVDSTRINATGDTAYYYQNGVLIGTGAITGGGGGGSGTVTSITAGTFLSGGTITTSGTIALDTASAGLKTYISDNKGTVNLASGVTGTLPVANGGTGATTLTSGAFLKGNGSSAVSGSSNLSETADTVFVSKFLNVDTATLYVDAVNSRVGFFDNSPSTAVEMSFSGHVSNTTTTKRLTISNDDPDYNAVTLLLNSKTKNSNLAFGQNDTVKVGMTYDTRGFFGIVNVVYDNRDFGFRLTDNGEMQYIDKPTSTTYFEIENDGRVFMPNVYADEISGTTRDLYIKDDGQLGYISSTAKSKTNINNLENVDWIYQLNPVSYNYRKKNENGDFTDDYYDKISYGLIAEEVESIADYMVYYDKLKEGGQIAVGINYSELITPILKAVQIQKQIIETQQTEINTIKSQLQLILTEINNLKNN